MKNTIIGLIEPSFYGLGYIDAAYNRGYEIISIVPSKDDPQKFGYEDKHKDLIIADIRDPESIINAIEKSPYKNKFTAIIPGCSYVSDIGAIVAERFGCRNIGVIAADKARYKDKTRIALEEAGLPNAKFAIVKNYEEAKSAVHKVGYPIICKPTNCDCSLYVALVENEESLSKYFTELSCFKTTYYDFKVRQVFLIEEYIDGPEYSIELFLDDKKILFASVTEKIKTEPPYFIELGHVVPTTVDQELTDTYINSAVDAVKALGLHSGAFHVEMRMSSRGPIVMEINARQAGDRIAQDLIINAFGINLFDACLDYYCGLHIELKQNKKKASAIAYLVAEKKGKVKSIKGIKELDSIPEIVTKNITVKKDDIVYPPINTDYRYGYIISVASSPKEAKQIVFDAIKSIEIEYY